MSRVFVRGWGAVSPAGWGAAALSKACAEEICPPLRQIQAPGSPRILRARAVPPATPRPAFSSHARLRRTSPIANFGVGAALEALGPDAAAASSGVLRLGIVYCAMSGCVNFSRRFYDETLQNPTTASPVIFPETVFNAPASHLGALLGTPGINYTLVGDPGTFLQGLALAADWLSRGRADGCLVVGGEELDWLVAQAFDLFEPGGIVSEGAGALYLHGEPTGPSSIELRAVTDSCCFTNKPGRPAAARRAREQLGQRPQDALLCDGLQGVERLDRDEREAWADWAGARRSPKRLLGEGFMAAAAWQCVLAVDGLSRGVADRACVSVVGCNEQAIAASFGRSTGTP